MSTQSTGLFARLAQGSLVKQILVGLVLGILLAMVSKPAAEATGLLGTLFVGALKAVAPVLVLMLVMASIANHQHGQKTNIRPILFLYLLGTFSAALTAVVFSFLFPSTLHLTSAAGDITPPSGIVEVLRGLLMSMVSNPITALMSGNYIGILVWAIGAISALLGVLYALAEQDIKRLLAWSTVENVGIILLAVGVAMVGLSLHDPLLTVVGLLGALFHLLNHALFKGLLFLGAGAIISRLHTHDMEKMGALAKRMPWTAAACLIGCLAISAIPPLNGFISEWYTWQSLFSLSRVEAVALQLAGPIAMVMLAVTGGLAVMCFVKMYGITFCGAPRSTHAEEAQEVPNTMIVAMLLLAALCVLIALSASWLAPKIMHIAHAFTNTPPVTVASGIALVPGTFHTRVTPSLLLLLLLAMPLLPGLYWLWCRSRRAAFRRTGDAWACGYGWENAMAPSGNGVMQPLRVVFSALFRLRQQLDPTLRLNKGLAHVTARAQSTEPFWDERVIRPIVSATQRLAKEIQHLQSGDFRLYCLYVVAALVVLLIAIAV